MPKPKDAPDRQPGRLGEPLPGGPAARRQRARITPDEIAAAVRYWREHAPADLKDLLDAEPAS